ncbi:MAG: PrsW family glutamic-type intramembrane protease [Limisphaerales bacterium]
MRYFLIDSGNRRIGPYAREELALFVARGLIEADCLVVSETGEEEVRLDAILPPGAPPPLESPRQPPKPAVAGVTGSGIKEPPSATRDFLRLAPHLMLPLRDMRRLPWRENRRIMALAFVGLVPLILMLHLHTTRNLAVAIWGVAIYSSMIWAIFFYITFAPSGIQVSRALLTFAGSSVFSISLVALARWIIPFQWVMVWISAPNLTTRWAGHLVGVAFVEELAKLFPLYFLWPSRLGPRAMMFYGLVAGLGFGIYEGVTYQSSYNLQVSFPDGMPTAQGAGVYYMLNILRLTSLPFLHAMWTGIAGYFIGLAAQFPRRPGGFFLAAILVPSVLHSTYNTFSTSLASVSVAFLTVLALNLYLFKGQDFERAFENETENENENGNPSAHF